MKDIWSEGNTVEQHDVFIARDSLDLNLVDGEEVMSQIMCR